MKLLLHPLVMPVYTLALYMEIERQSYVINYTVAFGSVVMLILLMLLSEITFRSQHKYSSPFANVESKAMPRITMALSVAIVLTTITFVITSTKPYTWGAKYILIIYILPSLFNIFSGAAAGQISKRLDNTFAAKSNAAPPAFIGALSGFTIMIGYKTGIDSFWTFVITLLMFTLQSASADRTINKPQIIWYTAGLMQSAAILYFCE